MPMKNVIIQMKEIESMTHVVLMDGGLETQLKRYAGNEHEEHPLWISMYLKENPEVCRKAHQDYIHSGAKMIFTSTYQATVEGFQQSWNISREEALGLFKLSVILCKQAVQLENEKGNITSVSIVGTVGPYGAFLHDGSEYEGGKYIDSMACEELAEWHKPKVQALLEAEVDYLIFATIPSLKEAEAVIFLLKQYPGKKAILSFSAQNETTISHGEKLSEVAQRCWDLAADQILAIGVNCQHPQLSVPLLSSIKKANPDIPLFVRSNTTEIFNKTSRQWEVSDSSRTLSEYCHDWLELGVQYIGGCCRTTVEDISNYRKLIDNFKSTSR